MGWIPYIQQRDKITIWIPSKFGIRIPSSLFVIRIPILLFVIWIPIYCFVFWIPILFYLFEDGRIPLVKSLGRCDLDATELEKINLKK